MPIDIQRIDVYGYTGRQRRRLRPALPSSGASSRRVPVVAPPKVDQDAPPPPPPDPPAGALPGATVTIVDRLDEDELVQGTVYIDPRAAVSTPAPVTAIDAVVRSRRFYLAIPFSVRGRPGPPGMQAELVLTALPDPPSEVRATYTTRQAFR